MISHQYNNAKFTFVPSKVPFKVSYREVTHTDLSPKKENAMADEYFLLHNFLAIKLNIF